MEIRLEDPAGFAARAASWLAGEALSANVIGVQLAGVLSGERVAGPADLWIVLEEGDSVVGAAMRPPPLDLSPTPLPPLGRGPCQVSWRRRERSSPT